MGFGNYTPRTYIKLKHGHVVMSIKAEDEHKYQAQIEMANKIVREKNKRGDDIIDICYSFIEGKLIKIDEHEAEFNGTKVKQWNVILEDDEGEQFVWTVYWDSYLIQSFVNCLASVEGDINHIKIQAYEKDGFQNAVFYHNGEKMEWKYQPKELPPVEDIMVVKNKKQVPLINPKTGKPEKDKTARMDFFIDRIKEINDKLGWVMQDGVDEEVTEEEGEPAF